MPQQHPTSRDDLFQRLAELGIATTTHEHMAVFTVAESTALEQKLPGAHTKNLFLKDAKGQLFLVVAEAMTAVDLKSLHKRLGCQRLSFGKPDLLMERLGITPGSVTAFAIMNDIDGHVTLVVDEALMGYDIINCHPLTNTATTAIKAVDLFTFFKACRHEPKIMRLTAGPL
jgi:Ala-tRNA(Pro) deacylase